MVCFLWHQLLTLTNTFCAAFQNAFSQHTHTELWACFWGDAISISNCKTAQETGADSKPQTRIIARSSPNYINCGLLPTLMVWKWNLTKACSLFLCCLGVSYEVLNKQQMSASVCKEMTVYISWKRYGVQGHSTNYSCCLAPKYRISVNLSLKAKFKTCGEAAVMICLELSPRHLRGRW